MALIANWDGARLELLDEQGERQFVFEPPSATAEFSSNDIQDSLGEISDGATSQAGDIAPEATRADMHGVGSVLALGNVDAPVAAFLLPAEYLLQRPFSLPFEHPRYIDAAMLGQELADQAGSEEADWWLCWQAEREEGGVRGLVFALSQSLREELSKAPISSQCSYIGPDVAVRMAAQLKTGMTSTAVLDADADGLMLGVYMAGTWRGMRRLNLSAGRSLENLAHEAFSSLKAMGFDAAMMPLTGRLDTAWRQAFDSLALPVDINWQADVLAEDLPNTDAKQASGEDAEQSLEESHAEKEKLPTRHVANTLAMASLSGELPFNFRHGAWGIQTDWSKRIGPWRRAALLLLSLCLLVIGQDAYQLQQLQARQEAVRSGVEQAFHQALPGAAMVDPMLQLRQAAGGGASGDAWKFLRHLEGITNLGRKEASFRMQNISFADGEVLLSGMVPDFAAANRVRDALASILGRKVELLDTDLSDKQVRIRLRWPS